MTITKHEMTEYEFSTEMRDRLNRARGELRDAIQYNQGYFEDDEKFMDTLVGITADLTCLIEKVDREIGIHYRRLTTE